MMILDAAGMGENRMTRSLPGMVLAFLIPPFAAMAQPQDATDATAQAATVPGWSQICTDGTCQVQRSLTEKNSGRHFMSLSVVLHKDQPGVGIALVLPLGIALQDGVALGGGRDFRTLPILTCTPDGCLAEIALDPVSLDLFASQDQITVSFSPYGAEKIDIPMPLTGLPEALTAARAELDG